MSATIVDLRNYRSTVRSKNGIPFPQVFRLHGFYFDIDGGQMTPSERPAPFLYTLSNEGAAGLANVTYEPISKMDTGIDSGWLFVRHHMTEQSVEGYLDSSMDHFIEDSLASATVFRTKEGLFTLHHRKANENARDHAIIYVNKYPHDPGPNPLGILPEMLDGYKIYHSDGTISEDPDELYPSLTEKFGED